MAKIGLTIFASGFTGKLIIRWLENSAPLAEVGRSAAFDFPYSNTYAITDLNPVAHIVQLWQSTDGVALTQLIAPAWQIDATLYNEISSITYQYLVDRGYTNLSPVVTGTEVWADPADIATVLVDERLAGATQQELYVVEAGYGPKLDSEYSLQAGGGIILLNGKTFDTGVGWFITHNRIITTSGEGVTATVSEISDVQVITANIDFYTSPTVNLYDKLAIANGSASVLTITFQAFSLIPNNTRVSFNTHRGSQKYLKLQFNGGDTIYFNGTARNVIYLAKGEEIKLWWKGSAGYVVSYSGNDKIRGQVVADFQDRSGISGAYLLADEGTGVLTGTDYPGLYEWLQALPPGATVSHATWALGKTKWALDTIAGTFRVPHLANMHRRFRINSAEAPGTYQDDGVGPHEHKLRHGRCGGIDSNPGGGGVANLSLNPFDEFGWVLESEYGTETTVKSFKEIPLIVL